MWVRQCEADSERDDLPPIPARIASNEEFVPPPQSAQQKEYKAGRERTQQLIVHLCKNDLDACVRMTDPASVSRESIGVVKLRFGVITTLFKVGSVTEGDVRIDKITVASDKKTADVVVSIRTQGEWKPQQPYRWVKVDGVWYITFG